MASVREGRSSFVRRIWEVAQKEEACIVRRPVVAARLFSPGICAFPILDTVSSLRLRPCPTLALAGVTHTLRRINNIGVHSFIILRFTSRFRHVPAFGKAKGEFHVSSTLANPRIQLHSTIAVLSCSDSCQMVREER